MTKIYCLKCKLYTETENENWDKDQLLLTGTCAACGRKKVTFTNEKGTFKKKTVKELKIAREKRKEASMNRKAKLLGREILDAEKKVQKGKK